MTTDTIKQAAKDYDISVETAKSIHDADPESFYQNLEQHLKETK